MTSKKNQHLNVTPSWLYHLLYPSHKSVLYSLVPTSIQPWDTNELQTQALHNLSSVSISLISPDSMIPVSYRSRSLIINADKQDITYLKPIKQLSDSMSAVKFLFQGEQLMPNA